MTNQDIFRELTYVDPALVADAAPREGVRRPMTRRWVRWGTVAACLCVIAGLSFRIGIANTPSQMTDIYREGIRMDLTDLDELPARYHGTLLVKNLDVSSYEFYYKEGGEPTNTEDWYSLLLYPEVEGGSGLMHCIFGNPDIEDWKVDMVFTKEATETKIIHGVEVQIARRELSLKAEYAYYAIFKYDGVVYDLRTDSDDEGYIYKVLDILLRDRT